MLCRYRLKARHHKSSEKTRHFNYPDYFTYPVCQHQAVAKGVRMIEVPLYTQMSSESYTVCTADQTCVQEFNVCIYTVVSVAMCIVTM